MRNAFLGSARTSRTSSGFLVPSLGEDVVLRTAFFAPRTTSLARRAQEVRPDVGQAIECDGLVLRTLYFVRRSRAPHCGCRQIT
jgi:hypothetical protein